MSVLRIPVRAMKMLIAPILTVHTVVPVNKDSLEMEQFVKVCQSILSYPKVTGTSMIPYALSFFVVVFVLIVLFFPFLLHQISMSVLPYPVRVTKTLIVRTVTVLSAVLVNRDSLEMEQFVKV